jgi:Alginate export
MKKIYITLLVWSSAGMLTAQNNPINMLRYNDNFAYLANDTVVKKRYEKLKMHPLSKNALLSVGGDIREQLMHTENQNFGDVPPTTKAVSATQLWHRVMVHADVKLGKKARIFTQLNHTLRLFNPNPLIEIDENQLGLHQAFLELQPTTPLSIRLGRQELSYGNNRILTFREGPNNRFAFDAAVVKWQNPNFRIDFIAATPVFQKPKIGDDETFKELITGIYATKTVVPKKLMLDFHTLYFNSNRIKYNLELGVEERVSMGARLFSRNPKFNYELEATYQSGRFNTLTINAFSIAYDVKYVLEAKTKFTLGLAGNYISGDKNKSDGQLNSYNLLYSKPSFGLAAPLGASNIVNINPYIQWSPLPKLQLLTGVYFLSRQSNQDGIYTPNMIQTRPNRKEVLFNTATQNIGNQYVFEVAYQHNNQWAFYFDTAYFTPANFTKATGKSLPIGYYSFKSSYKF